ncbi:MAG: hypothetical protein ABIE74_12495 [Pseudomonadota bacterium]
MVPLIVLGLGTLALLLKGCAGKDTYVECKGEKVKVDKDSSKKLEDYCKSAKQLEKIKEGKPYEETPKDGGTEKMPDTPPAEKPVDKTSEKPQEKSPEIVAEERAPRDGGPDEPARETEPANETAPEESNKETSPETSTEPPPAETTPNSAKIRWMFTELLDCSGYNLPADTAGQYQDGKCEQNRYIAGGVIFTMNDNATTGGTWTNNTRNCNLVLAKNSQGSVGCSDKAKFTLEIANCGNCNGSTFTVDFTK